MLPGEGRTFAANGYGIGLMREFANGNTETACPELRPSARSLPSRLVHTAFAALADGAILRTRIIRCKTRDSWCRQNLQQRIPICIAPCETRANGATICTTADGWPTPCRLVHCGS